MLYQILRNKIKKINVGFKSEDIDYKVYEAVRDRDEGNIKKALESLQSILSSYPNHAAALNLYGSLLLNNNRFQPPYTLAQELTHHNPESSGAWIIQAIAARSLGLIEEALDAAKNAERLGENPSIVAYIGVIYLEKGMPDEAIKQFTKASEMEPENQIYQSDRLFAMSCSGNISLEYVMEEHLKWGREIELSTPKFNLYKNKNNSKIQIGLVSSDFKNHPVALFIIPFLEKINKIKFEIISFNCFDGLPDDYTKRIKELSSVWYECGFLLDYDLAKLIHNVGIDILVDLSGHTAGNKLVVFAMKPAPIQVSWFGYMNTTGLKSIDYRFTDGYLSPPSIDKFYSEKLYRIDSIASWSPDISCPDVETSPYKTNGYITFGSFNRWWKITDKILESWAMILKGKPNSRLKIIANGADDVEFCRKIKEKFEGFGVDFNRIILLPNVTLKEFYKQVSSVDISLDSFPYNGGSTTLNTIWMGVPVVCIKGQNEISRAGYSILSNLNISDLCAENHEEYIQIAINLANNIQRLESLRDGLRTIISNSSMMNHDLVVRGIENAFAKMHKSKLIDQKIKNAK